jgi:hypothetical protein
VRLYGWRKCLPQLFLAAKLAMMSVHHYYGEPQPRRCFPGFYSGESFPSKAQFSLTIFLRSISLRSISNSTSMMYSIRAARHIFMAEKARGKLYSCLDQY